MSLGINLHVPSCLKLDSKQLNALNKFMLDNSSIPSKMDETCVVTSPISFYIRETGVATSIIAEYKDKKINLTLDDDGNLCSEV